MPHCEEDQSRLFLFQSQRFGRFALVVHASKISFEFNISALQIVGRSFCCVIIDPLSFIDLLRFREV